jgi:hypothetical protein
MPKSLADTINNSYDKAMLHPSATLTPDGRFEIDKIGFHNVGYWRGIEDSVELAGVWPMP